jgi:hypothetical protein
MKHSEEVMTKAILSQNKKITETYVIIVVGIYQEVMAALDKPFMESPGFIEMSDTNRTDKNGCWAYLGPSKTVPCSSQAHCEEHDGMDPIHPGCGTRNYTSPLSDSANKHEIW